MGLHRLARDERGVTMVEFALVAPVMLLLLLGGFDIAHTLYTRGVLQGIVQKTGRDGTLEVSVNESRQDALDLKVLKQAHALVNNAKVDIERRYYRSYAQAAAAKKEEYTDTNKNGTCDAGEPYVDANNNNQWDDDGGDEGQGGAKDVVVYTVTMTYAHMFPLYRFIGGSDSVKLVATTILRNQPYGDQAVYGAAKPRNCS